MNETRPKTDPNLTAPALDLEEKTLDEVKGFVMTIDARGEKTAERMGALEEIIGYPPKPGAFAGDPDVPGKGMAGALDRLAKNDLARARSHSLIAARTGGITAAVLAVVLKLAEMFFASRGLPPQATYAPPSSTPPSPTAIATVPKGP